MDWKKAKKFLKYVVGNLRIILNVLCSGENKNCNWVSSIASSFVNKKWMNFGLKVKLLSVHLSTTHVEATHYFLFIVAGQTGWFENCNILQDAFATFWS